MCIILGPLAISKARNEAFNEDMLLFVLPFGCQIEYDPDVYLACRCLYCIELGTIYREHEDNVVLSNVLILESFNKLSPMQNITISVKAAISVNI
jgi:hypothetical protein